MADSYIWRVDFRGVKIRLIRIVIFMCIRRGSHGIVRALSVHTQGAFVQIDGIGTKDGKRFG